MANIIALVWDFDKTLIEGYMQDPIFKKYSFDGNVFWAEVNSLPEKYKTQGIRVNPDTIYLNHFIKYAKEDIFPGLNNQVLFDLGKELKFYKGLPLLFEDCKKLIEDDPVYKEYNIKQTI